MHSRCVATRVTVVVAKAELMHVGKTSMPATAATYNRPQSNFLSPLMTTQVSREFAVSAAAMLMAISQKNIVCFFLSPCEGLRMVDPNVFIIIEVEARRGGRCCKGRGKWWLHIPA